jgi:radical SAM protein with 4Fe4S-binding SPASM domain
MCPYGEVSKSLPQGRMSKRLYAKIIEECSKYNLHRISPYLMNEPLLDPKIVDRINYAKELNKNATIRIATNASLLSKEKTHELIQSKLDCIVFSINGMSKETYESTMIGLNFDKVMDNINYFFEVADLNRIKVKVIMLRTKTTNPEIPDAVRFWKDRGAEVVTAYIENRAGNVKRFDELNIVKEYSPQKVCSRIFTQMYILYNGDVVLCCDDWRRQVILGNVERESIVEVWRGKQYNEIRKKHLEGKFGELILCKECTSNRIPLLASSK